MVPWRDAQVREACCCIQLNQFPACYAEQTLLDKDQASAFVTVALNHGPYVSRRDTFRQLGSGRTWGSRPRASVDKLSRVTGSGQNIVVSVTHAAQRLADRKLIVRLLYREQKWPAERIAAALNVSQQTISRDLEPDTRRCKTCLAQFVPKRSDARHCSAACKQKAYRHSLKPVEPAAAVVLVGEARREAIKTIKRRHYTRSVPSGKSHFMAFRDAIVVWSIPANNNIGRFVLGWDGGVVWELTRLWAPDGHEKNLLTRAISFAVKRLIEIENPDAVVSYADPNVGHLGGIYRAASWIDHGQSDESRAYRGPSGQVLARRAFHSGRNGLRKAEIAQLGYAELSLPGKHRFVRFLSKRARKAAGPLRQRRREPKGRALDRVAASGGFTVAREG